MTELYLLFKYLRPNELEGQNINTFDAWAAIFAKKSIDYEFSVTIEIVQKERFRYFIKVPELAAFYADNKVDVIIYAVEKSLDAYKFGLLHNKQLFVRQLKNNSLSRHTIDEGSMDEKGSNPKEVGQKLNEIADNARTHGAYENIGTLYGFNLLVKSNFPSNPLKKAKDKPKTLLKRVYPPFSRINRKRKQKLLVFQTLQYLIPKKKSKEHWKIGLQLLRQVARQN